MALNVGVFNNLRGFADYARAEEEFQQKKQQLAQEAQARIMQQKLQQAQIDEIPYKRGMDAEELALKKRELGLKFANEQIVPEGTAPTDPIMASLVNVESNGNPNALSPKGAAGAFQIMPDTARDPGFGVRPLQGWNGADPRTATPEEQARFAKDYFDAMLSRNGGDHRLALASYNAGPGAVDNAKQVGGGDYNATMANLPQETQNYVPKVMAGAGEPIERRPRFLMKGGKPYTEGLKPGMQWAMDEKGQRYAAQIPGSNVGGEDGFKNENTLRDEFNTLTKDFRTVQDAYSKIKKTSATGAGDMSMLYSYVKLLDPGSVVRESEFATAAASGSFGERIQGAAKSILEGGRLAPTLRAEFLNEADNIYQGQKSGYDRLKKNYTAIALRNKLNPENVTVDYTAPEEATPSGVSKIDAVNELRRRGKI